MKTYKKQLTKKLTTKKGKFSVEEAIALCERGMSLTEAAKLLGVSKQSVSKKLRRYNYSHERLKSFKESKADLLALLQSNILQGVTQEEIKKANLQQKMWAFGVAFDKERLQRDLSTSNVSLFEKIVLNSHTNPRKRYT